MDSLPVFEEADDPHASPPLRAAQGINLVDFLNQSGAVFPVFPRTPIGFQDAGHPIVFSFFSLSSGDITLLSI